MTKDEKMAKAIDVLIALCHNEALTHKQIVDRASAVMKLLNNYPTDHYNDDIIDEIVLKYESNIGVKTFDPDVIVADHGSDVWFTTRRDDIPHYYFDRYKAYLRHEGFGVDVINSIQLNCESTLSRCANPVDTSLNTSAKKRGMVIGDVQAGKTANYLGLINMACDYGYRVIVLLSGLTDSLRKQTQERVDSGFIGASSTTIGNQVQYIGVGALCKSYYAIPLTNMENDFAKFIQKNLNAAATDFNKPVILVVKKNASILESVHKWLKPGKNRISGESILIIDDEADNASVNTKRPENDPSSINKKIRNIYNNFPIASYVGVTATPFANIFINPQDASENNQDLFPADFIVQLNAPSNYFGSEKVFPIDGSVSRHVRKLEMGEPNFIEIKHKKDMYVSTLPSSLKEAILSFLINNVIRTLEGNGFKHRSMMINVSALNDPQESLNYGVTSYVNKLKNIIEQESNKPVLTFILNTEMSRMYQLYTRGDENGVDFYEEQRNKHPWGVIQQGLYDEIVQFETTIINNRYRGERRFDYNKYSNKGARVIVIGGFVLSRGLTLEGLCTSYYSRSATAYDTLLQMCRWFGYRPGYENLCRIYISQSNIDYFAAVLEAVRNLKDQFREMELQRKTPRDFGLMVQQSPDTLDTSMLITARNKMHHTGVIERVLNYGGVYADTSKLFKDVSKNKANLNRLEEFYTSLNQQGVKLAIIDKRHMFRRVSKENIAVLLKKISIPMVNKKFDCQSLSNYIQESDQFPEWDVVIATGESERKKGIGIYEINVPSRTFHLGEVEENFIRVGGANNRIIDPGIFDSGLGLTTKKRAELLLQKQLRFPGKKINNLSSTDLLHQRENPILVIYYLDLQIDDNVSMSERDACVAIKESFGSDFLAGFAVGFPAKNSTVLVKYRANKIKLDEAILEEEEFEEDELIDE